MPVRIDLASTTTLLVGANNSGKSSAMLALRKFLLSKATAFRLQNLTLFHLAVIDTMGADWQASGETFETPTANERSHWLIALFHRGLTQRLPGRQ
ncbi:MULTISPECIES: AAA family ATPase [unclassified Pseudomonas]|uniref:AAA family ATPase n=1 Tax=unclassified Pseudomonas TaxID=196821 RepID=UPI002870699E|nr:MULTISPECIES: AAA family ATPase [unclassified Pseudomonas]